MTDPKGSSDTPSKTVANDEEPELTPAQRIAQAFAANMAANMADPDFDQKVEARKEDVFRQVRKKYADTEEETE